jgi:phosphoglycolate phosphatase-like HAD superfamily hydrolase
MDQYANHLDVALCQRRITHVIFDFDGTLSWLRHGWPDIMLELFCEFLPKNLQNSPQLRGELRHDILGLNGRPSIHQILSFCERARNLGLNTPDTEVLLRCYLDRLASAMAERVHALESGIAKPSDFIIAAANDLLAMLRRRNLTLIILSGTGENDVRREAALLGLSPFFGKHIYGSTPDTSFSKKDVIDRILHEERINGSHLLSFGDGPVEIEFTKAVGGLAIGVASDEHVNGSGRIDLDKREHLLRAGADAIIPDYQDAENLIARIFP